MKNYLSNLLNKLKAWKEAKEEESKQPLVRENAYTLSCIGKKKGQYKDVLKDYLEKVLKDISLYAKMGEMYILKIYPDYLSVQDKALLENELTTLGYSVCYNDSNVILISWKYSKEDFMENVTG